MYKYAHVPSINNVCQQQQTTKSNIFQQQFLESTIFFWSVHTLCFFMKVARLHLILSDIITWCGLENSDIWDSSCMTKSGCGCGHRIINCANSIWLKSDDRLEKASIIISAASWFLTRLEIIKSYYTLILGMFIYQKDCMNDVYNCFNLVMRRCKHFIFSWSYKDTHIASGYICMYLSVMMHK
jgi:hypothetical protein